MLVALILIITCGVLDRLIGWGGYGRSKPVLGGLLALIGIAYVATLGAAGNNATYWLGIVTFGLAFFVWRTPQWHLFGGSINPAANKVFGTFLRHCLALAFLLPAYYLGYNLTVVGAAMIVFALGATCLARINAKGYDVGKDYNDEVEITRGILLGLCLSIGFGLG